MSKIPLVVLAGPTGVGKTETSIKLAKKFNAEIISADSMQVYKYMDIGTAKIDESDMQGVAHHLIDIAEPTETFSVCRYKELCKEKIGEITASGKVPFLVGGTGLYIDSVVDDVDFSPQESDMEYRVELENLAREKGNEYVHSLLCSIDEASGEKIHANNVKRVIRALEYYHLTGETISSHNEKSKEKDSPYNTSYIFLTRDRDELYERIDKRVDIMLRNGLEDEVKKLLSMGVDAKNTSMQAIGYKEIAAYLEGGVPYDVAVEELKKNSRHYAKRQITWFSRRSDVHRVNLTELGDDALSVCESLIEKILEKGECDL